MTESRKENDKTGDGKMEKGCWEKAKTGKWQDEGRKMARDVTLDTRAIRSRLKQRREPYWRTLSKKKGQALGYRKGARVGTWIAKHYINTLIQQGF